MTDIAEPAIDGVDEAGDDEGGSGRRRFLAGGAIAAAAAVAGVALTSDPASAANGNAIVIGSATNTGTLITTLTGSTFKAVNGSTSSTALIGSHLLVAELDRRVRRGLRGGRHLQPRRHRREGPVGRRRHRRLRRGLGAELHGLDRRLRPHRVRQRRVRRGQQRHGGQRRQHHRPGPAGQVGLRRGPVPRRDHARHGAQRWPVEPGLVRGQGRPPLVLLQVGLARLVGQDVVRAGAAGGSQAGVRHPCRPGPGVGRPQDPDRGRAGQHRPQGQQLRCSRGRESAR